MIGSVPVAGINVLAESLSSLQFSPEAGNAD